MFEDRDQSRATGEKLHPSGAVYASWRSRFLAEIIDGFAVLIVLRVVALLLPEAFDIVAIGGGFLYNGMLDGGPRGQTFGKIALRIRVIDDGTGDLIGVQRGFLRALPPLAFGVLGLLSTSTFVLAITASLLDGLWPLWHPRRQAWHDMVAGSVVVRAGAPG